MKGKVSGLKRELYSYPHYQNTGAENAAWWESTCPTSTRLWVQSSGQKSNKTQRHALTQKTIRNPQNKLESKQLTQGCKIQDQHPYNHLYLCNQQSQRGIRTHFHF